MEKLLKLTGFGMLLGGLLSLATTFTPIIACGLILVGIFFEKREGA